MLESLVGIEYLVKMLSDVNLIKNGGIIGLTIAIADFLILSSPLVCLISFKNRSIFSYFMKLVFYISLTLLFVW
jgi:hypothetical protein